MPRLASEPGSDKKTESREHTEVGIMVGAARAPAPVAMQDSAVEQPPAEQSAPSSPARTSTTRTHRGLTAVPRQPGPTLEAYAALLDRLHELEERYDALQAQHEEAIKRDDTLLAWLEKRITRLEPKLSAARQKSAEQAVEISRLKDELRRSQAARDALLLVLQEVTLNPPDSELFRGHAAAALAAIAAARAAEPPATTGDAT